MDVYTALRERRSISALDSRVPPRDVVQRLLDVAVWAPNHHLTEPWRFHVIARDARQSTGEAIAKRLEGELDSDDPACAGEIKGARTKFLRAPVVIVVSQVRSEDQVTDLEDYAACSCAVQNLMLAAHAEGLATKWRTGAMCEYAATRDVLELGNDDRLVGFIYVGYPASSVPPDERQRTDPDVAWLGWDE